MGYNPSFGCQPTKYMGRDCGVESKSSPKPRHLTKSQKTIRPLIHTKSPTRALAQLANRPKLLEGQKA